jgi:drug/metabolite transporter (DMT)-like permease
MQGWNLVVKQAQHRLLFIWWAVVAGALCSLIVVVVSAPLPLHVWPYILASAVAEALYFITLTRAYDSDDFSLTYPLARGAAPVLLMLWAALFLGETPRPGGLLGVMLLIIGLIIVGSGPLLSKFSSTKMSTKGLLLALLTASCVSLYTAIDGAAVRFVAPAPYTILVLGLSAILSLPVVIKRYSAPVVFAEWRTNWLRILLVGLVMLLTYVLVLFSYSLARVSYAGAVREVSIVFAALAGWLWLGEGFGLIRTAGALLIFCGIMMIALLG